MNLLEVKKAIQNANPLQFRLPNGDFVPQHFHVTEIGVNIKDFVDCGGKVRTKRYLTFQLWTADDTEHRLTSEKLLKIIEHAENSFGNLDHCEVEVEFQSDTIGRYELEFDESFRLANKRTDCLAKDKCGIPTFQVFDEFCCETGCC